MSLKFVAFIAADKGGYGYIAWFDKVKGIIVQASSVEEAVNELLISMKVKVSYEYDIPIEQIEAKEISFEEFSQTANTKYTQKNLSFAVA